MESDRMKRALFIIGVGRGPSNIANSSRLNGIDNYLNGAYEL
jgi:hypothetical protein